MRRFFKVVLCLAVLAPLALFLALAIGHRLPIELPHPTGHYAVGRSLYHWTNDVNHRDIMAWVWYPAASSPNSPAVEYLPAPWRAAHEQATGYVMGQLFNRDLSLIKAHSAADAPIAPASAPFPVVLMRAGGSALTTDFTSLAEDLASHGYIVAGFDAPYRSFLVVLPDGTVVRRSPAQTLSESFTPSNAARAESLLTLWVEDARFLVDQLSELNSATASRFRGRIDLAKLGAFGHSFGGATALQFCHEDARCLAAMDIDGIPFGSVVQEGLHKPAMFFLSDHGKWQDAEARAVLARIDAIAATLPPGEPPLYIHGANHFNFSDQMFQKAGLFTAAFQLFMGGTERYRGVAITTAYVHTFFDVYLKGESPEKVRALRQEFLEVRLLRPSSSPRPR